MINSTTNSTSAAGAGNLALLPPTKNPYLLLGGSLTLYNPILILTATALLQHTAVFGLIFLLRNFSPARALDLHFLTIIFALTFVAAPLVFLLDTRIDGVKLLFFLEHEALEYLLALRVLLPRAAVAAHAGRICLACWAALAVVSLVVALDSVHRHAADVVAWGAFASDLLLGVAGCVLLLRWLHARRFRARVLRCSGGQRVAGAQAPFLHPSDAFRARKERAEGLAGAAFVLHGWSTVAVAPVLTRVLYGNLHPRWFAYAWVVVFGAALGTVALCVPSAALFCGTVNWCCWHSRRVLPGEAAWEGDGDEVGGEQRDLEAGRAGGGGGWRGDGWRDEMRQSRRVMVRQSVRERDRMMSPGSGMYWTRLAEKHAHNLSPASPGVSEYKAYI